MKDATSARRASRPQQLSRPTPRVGRAAKEDSQIVCGGTTRGPQVVCEGSDRRPKCVCVSGVTEKADPGKKIDLVQDHPKNRKLVARGARWPQIVCDESARRHKWKEEGDTGSEFLERESLGPEARQMTVCVPGK